LLQGFFIRNNFIKFAVDYYTRLLFGQAGYIVGIFGYTIIIGVVKIYIRRK